MRARPAYLHRMYEHTQDSCSQSRSIDPAPLQITLKVWRVGNIYRKLSARCGCTAASSRDERQKYRCLDNTVFSSMPTWETRRHSIVSLRLHQSNGLCWEYALVRENRSRNANQMATSSEYFALRVIFRSTIGVKGSQGPMQAN